MRSFYSFFRSFGSNFSCEQVIKFLIPYLKEAHLQFLDFKNLKILKSGYTRIKQLQICQGQFNMSSMCIINQLSKKSGEIFFCYWDCSLINFGFVIPYFGPIHAVFMSYFPQTKQRATLSPRLSNFVPSFPSLLL